jgi:hypothetical protein
LGKFYFRQAPEQVPAEMVSGNFFRTLGAGAALGRVLTPQDDGAPGDFKALR